MTSELPFPCLSAGLSICGLGRGAENNQNPHGFPLEQTHLAAARRGSAIHLPANFGEGVNAAGSRSAFGIIIWSRPVVACLGRAGDIPTDITSRLHEVVPLIVMDSG